MRKQVHRLFARSHVNGPTTIDIVSSDKLKSFEAAEYLSVPKERVYELVKNKTLRATSFLEKILKNWLK